MRTIRISALAAAGSLCALAARGQIALQPGMAPPGVATGLVQHISCPDGTTSCFGGGSAVTQPTALSPTTIASANTYQQAFGIGAARTSGGFVQLGSGSTGTLCVDTSTGASAGLTTPTGGQLCGTAGSTQPITFPATSGPVYVFDSVAGERISGSAS